MPRLFGSTSCGCGYKPSHSEALAIEISYWEALRAYWRVYWPAQLFSISGSLAVGWSLTAVLGLGYTRQLLAQGFVQILIQFILMALGLFLFVHRLVSRPLARFALCAIVSPSEEAVRRFTIRRRAEVWFFLWWRQLAAGLLVSLLAAPLNILLGLFGLTVAPRIAMLAGVLIIGPILLKMLVGHQFSDFRLEVERFS
jgi:hypothetical protein